jgi:hypothetical protein
MLLPFSCLGGRLSRGATLVEALVALDTGPSFPGAYLKVFPEL